MTVRDGYTGTVLRSPYPCRQAQILHKMARYTVQPYTVEIRMCTAVYGRLYGHTGSVISLTLFLASFISANPSNVVDYSFLEPQHAKPSLHSTSDRQRTCHLQVRAFPLHSHMRTLLVFDGQLPYNLDFSVCGRRNECSM